MWYSSGNHEIIKSNISKRTKSKKPKKDLRIDQLEILDCGNIKESVGLPEGMDPQDWIAYNMSNFYNHISLLYSTISEYCTPETCPSMTAGSGYKYLWAEVSNPVDLPACEYIKLLFQWIEEQLDNEAIFPSDPDAQFPEGFESVVRSIAKRLFRVYAHLYYHHLDTYKTLETTILLNTSFYHFIVFCNHFNLISKDQLEPLRDVVESILT